MSEQPQQNLKNHAHFPKEFIIEALLMLPVLGVALYLVYAALVPGEGAEVSGTAVALAIGFLLHAIATTFIFVHLRFASLKLQDRLIRQEMRFRLSQVLPPEIQGRIGEFDHKQLIAMRFCCDEQMPELAQKVLDDQIQDLTTIKKMVKNWQADWMRI